tara:strand:- start:276 stop:431 length:156 start_codon:yes stop_codon:yes gene_type:complete
VIASVKTIAGNLGKPLRRSRMAPEFMRFFALLPGFLRFYVPFCAFARLALS